MPLGDSVRQVAGEADADGRRADLRDIVAETAEPEPVVDPEAVVESDGEDLRFAGGVEAGADLLGVAAQRDPPATGVLVGGVVGGDGVDGVVQRRADLLGVAAQVDVAGPVVDEDGVVESDGEDLRGAGEVGAGADLLDLTAQPDPLLSQTALSPPMA